MVLVKSDVPYSTIPTSTFDDNEQLGLIEVSAARIYTPFDEAPTSPAPGQGVEAAAKTPKDTRNIIVMAVYISTDTSHLPLKIEHLDSLTNLIMTTFKEDTVLVLGDFNTFTYRGIIKEWLDRSPPLMLNNICSSTRGNKCLDLALARLGPNPPEALSRQGNNFRTELIGV